MDVRKVAKLAHLEISDAEVELYTPQMASIVEYIEQLNALDTTEIEPMPGGRETGKAHDVQGVSCQTIATAGARRATFSTVLCQSPA